MIGRPVELWTEPVIALLAAYGSRDVLIELRGQLVVPQGWASILLQTRTHCLPRPVLKDRFAALSSLLLDLIESSRQEERESAAPVACRGSAQ